MKTIRRNLAGMLVGLVLGVGLTAALQAPAATDTFANQRTGLSTPAEHAFAITPGDADFTYTTRAVYIGTGGVVVATFAGGEEVTIENTADGAVYPWRLVNIDSTGTTASGLIGLY